MPTTISLFSSWPWCCCRSWRSRLAIVTDAIGPTDDPCDEPPPKQSSRQISVTYHWSKKRSDYIKDSEAFEKLSAENAKRF
jgi:hypothetical protein